MTQPQAVEKFLAGVFAAIGEYRMSKAETIQWRDKTNGQVKSAAMLRHVVEVGQASVTVNERVPDDVKAENINVPFHKGQRVLIEVSDLHTEKGAVSCRGVLHPVEDSTSPGQPAPVGVGKLKG
jgi:hypothetical protein